MSTISSCIIVKNEIKNLPGLVDDLKKFSDEIIIVDTGSDDGTKEWVREHTSSSMKLFYFDWVNDFSKARNFSFSLASMDWIFWCDADDRLSDKLIDEMLVRKPDLDQKEYNIYLLQYLFSPGTIVPRYSLMKKSDHPMWYGACHEYVEVDNQNVGEFNKDSLILHQREHIHTDRNMYIFINQILIGEHLSSRDLYYYANELVDNGYIWKAGDVVLKVIDDIWYVDAWNAINNILFHRWTGGPVEFFEEGINIIDRLWQAHPLRGDMIFIRSFLLYKLNEDLHQFLDGCKEAINTEVEGLDTYLENIDNSKVWPAINIYNITNDESMLEIIKKYENVSRTAYNFLNN